MLFLDPLGAHPPFVFFFYFLEIIFRHLGTFDIFDIFDIFGTLALWHLGTLTVLALYNNMKMFEKIKICCESLSSFKSVQDFHQSTIRIFFL